MTAKTSTPCLAPLAAKHAISREVGSSKKPRGVNRDEQEIESRRSLNNRDVCGRRLHRLAVAFKRASI